MIRRAATVALSVSLLATLGYTFAYLAEWEWHRATITALFAVLAAVALTGVLVGRSRRGPDAAPPPRRPHDERARELLRRTRPEHPFRWLDPGDTGVFIPLLLGAGVLLSGVGWLVERVARATAAPVAERHLAGRLATIALPDTLIDPDDSPDAFCTPGARP